MQLDYDITLEDQIRECFGRVVYTHKTHERMADNCAKKLNRFKVGQIVLTAATSTGAVGTAYVEAQKRLQKMEDMTFSADEIDCFLPLSLKRSGGRPKSDKGI